MIRLILFFISALSIAIASPAQTGNPSASAITDAKLNAGAKLIPKTATAPAVPLSTTKDTLTPLKKPDQASGSETNNKSANVSNDFKRDPFRLPEYLISKLVIAAAPTVDPALRIDDAVEPLRRWPLASYTLIGIIWDVKNPKALVADQQRKVHLVRLNDKIGNQTGYVASIREGSIVVKVGKNQEVLKLKK